MDDRFNNKGFTLTEILVTLTLLSIVTVISIVSVSGMLERQKEKELEEYIKTVETAACSYANLNDLRKSCSDQNNCELTTVTVDDLIQNGTISKDLTNPDTKSSIINNNGTITIKWIDGEKSCSYEE